jgi:hypothetical protein
MVFAETVTALLRAGLKPPRVLIELAAFRVPGHPFREMLMSAGSPSDPNRDAYLRLRKQLRQPTQAPALKGTILAATGPSYEKIRKATRTPTQAPTLKGTILTVSASVYARNRKSLKAPSQAPVVIKK